MSLTRENYYLWERLHDLICPVSLIRDRDFNFFERTMRIREVVNEISLQDPVFASLNRFITAYHESNGMKLHIEFTKVIHMWQHVIRKKYIREDYQWKAEVSSILSDSESFHPVLFHERCWYNNLLAIYNLISLHSLLDGFYWIPEESDEILERIKGNKEAMKQYLDMVSGFIWIQNMV
jgi:hypothetical protein